MSDKRFIWIMKASIVFLSVACLLAGCASSGIVQGDRDTFLVSKMSGAGAFGSPDALRTDLNAEAAQFCGAKGKQFETVEFVGTPGIPFVRITSARLQFRCI